MSREPQLEVVQARGRAGAVAWASWQDLSESSSFNLHTPPPPLVHTVPTLRKPKERIRGFKWHGFLPSLAFKTNDLKL